MSDVFPNKINYLTDTNGSWVTTGTAKIGARYNFNGAQLQKPVGRINRKRSLEDNENIDYIGTLAGGIFNDYFSCVHKESAMVPVGFESSRESPTLQPVYLRKYVAEVSLVC